MTTANDLHAIHLVDQAWLEVEPHIKHLHLLSEMDANSLVAALTSELPPELLIRKACALVADQCRQNIREREGS